MLPRYSKFGPVVLIAALILAGCGSAPPKPKASTVGAVQQTAPTGPVPERALAEFQQALGLMSAGNYPQAQVALTKLAGEYPHYAGPHANLGIIYMRLERLEEAEKALQEAVRRNPASAAAQNQLGILHRKQGRFAEAEAAYKRAIAADPNYAIAHLNQGVLYDLYLQKPSEALASYERFQALQPQTPTEIDQPVDKWIKELRLRIARDPQTAKVSE